ncbi:hypothetical protein E4U12_007408 [Claviceps purpurea]|nr:hypothetical protein E4U12_007408 [Claviceps purpurea]
MDGGGRECAGFGIGAPGAAAFARENSAVVSGMTANLVSIVSVASVVCVLCKEKQDSDKSILDGQDLGRV